MARPVKLDVDGLTFKEDYRVLDDIIKDLKYLNTMHIQYGIVKGEKYPSGDPRGRAGMYVAEIMKRNEYGLDTTTEDGRTINLPPRPLFRQSLTKGKIEGSTYFQYLADSVFNRTFKQDMLHMVASKMPETIKAEFAEQNLQENSPVTVQQKAFGVGDDTVLYDTGVLYESFSGIVTRGNILRPPSKKK